MDEVYYGVLFSLAGNICITLGHHMKAAQNDPYDSTLTKLDHSKTRGIRRSQCKRCSRGCMTRLFGHLFFFGGSAASAYALAYAPQTLLACIGSIQFVTNLVCSRLFHAKAITFPNIMGTLAVIIGCLFIVFGFSAHGATAAAPPSISDLFLNYNTDQYTTYLIVVLFLASLTLVWGCVCGSPSPDASGHLSKKKLSHLTSNGASWMRHKRFEYYFTISSGVVYAVCSAMPGTQSVVLGKTLAVIARSYMSGKLTLFEPIDVFNIVFISIVMLSWLATQIFWIYRCNESMKRFDPVFIMPMNQVMWITFSTVAGGLYFHEFEHATNWQWVALISGLMFNYLGLFHLVPESDSKKKLSYADVSNMDQWHTSHTSHKKSKKHKQHSHSRQKIQNMHTRNFDSKQSKEMNSSQMKLNINLTSDMSGNDTINSPKLGKNANTQSNLKKRGNKQGSTPSPKKCSGGGILSKTRKIPSIFTNFVSGAFNSLKDAMAASPGSVATPGDAAEQEPLLTVSVVAGGAGDGGKNSDSDMGRNQNINNSNNNNNNNNNKQQSSNSSISMAGMDACTGSAVSGSSSVTSGSLTDTDIAAILQNIDYGLQSHKLGQDALQSLHSLQTPKNVQNVHNVHNVQTKQSMQSMQSMQALQHHGMTAMPSESMDKSGNEKEMMCNPQAQRLSNVSLYANGSNISMGSMGSNRSNRSNRSNMMMSDKGIDYDSDGSESSSTSSSLVLHVSPTMTSASNSDAGEQDTSATPRKQHKIAIKGMYAK